MRDVKGWLWPDADTVTPAVVLREIVRLPQYLAHVPASRRQVCVQAGGNAGIYAVALAKHFATIHTVEPEPENYACLVENIKRSKGRIVARRAAFGNQPGFAESWRATMEQNNYGASRLRLAPPSAAATVPVLRLDDEFDAVDFLLLDVEGWEQPALEGAAGLIEKSRPVIAIEQKGLGEPLGWPDAHTAAWLKGHSYRLAAQIGNDQVWTPF